MINRKEIKQTLFADDATFLNRGKQVSFEKLKDVLENFEKASSLKLNSQKSTVLRIGSLRQANIINCKNKNFLGT